MFLIILVLLYSDILATSTENAVLMINVPKEKDCVLPYPSILLEDEPCQILVMNPIGIYEGKCNNVHGQNIKFSNIKHNGERFQATIHRVKSIDGDRWSCEFYSGSRFWTWTTKCNARFHLRTKKPVASISLNNQRMDATRTRLSITHYDAEVTYTFDDDETVFIDCKPSLPSRPRTTMIRYYNSTGGTVLQTSDSSEDISITLKLAQEAHTNYIDCIYTNNYNDISVTRLVFQLKSSHTKSTGIITLHINGMYVRPTGNVYHYVYYEGETIDISCESRHDDRLLNLDYNGKSTTAPLKVSMTINSKKNNYSDVICTATMIGYPDDKQVVRVTFIKSLSDFYVTGLNKGKILKQYKETEYSSIIYYQYTSDERLTLNCTKTVENNVSTKLKWMFNDTSIIYTAEINNYTNIYLTILLQANDDNLLIRCINELNTTYSNVTHEISIKLKYKVTDSDYEDSEMLMIWLSVIIGMVIFIVIIIAFIVKHKINKRQPSENYVNLPNIDDRLMPHPTQWNEANNTQSENSEPDCENRVPINKKRKAKYKLQTKTCINDSDRDYENVEYTNQNVAMEPTLNYADILILNNNKKYKKTDGENYSQIQFTNASTDDSNYVNISMMEGPSYVNSHAGEEPVEPTYCEIQVQVQDRD